MQQRKKLVIIGGGPAGFFAAIHAAKAHPDWFILILEQGNHVLGKVKISGGGRCNITHACFDSRELTQFYPRGHKELLASFKLFGCVHTLHWFEERNVPLKTEKDGRVFPVTDDSQTIIDCLLNEAKKNQIEIRKNCKVFSISHQQKFSIKTDREALEADVVIVACGSSSLIWETLKEMGHTVIPPVPSLFSFKTKNTLFRNLSGIAIPNCSIKTNADKVVANGTVLITHEGMSGPAILKLSAFSARKLAEKNYQFDCSINWCNAKQEDCLLLLQEIKSTHTKKQIHNFAPYDFPARFWENVLLENKIPHQKLWADISKNELQKLAQFLTNSTIQISGKSTNKDEFVTAGGIKLSEVDFKTMQSKFIPGLYFAGEVLDIDGVTGGFNFQSCWTTGYIAGVMMNVE